MPETDDALTRPLTIHASEASVVITCHCRIGNQPILISSVALDAVCAHCRRLFSIAAVEYDVQVSPAVNVKIAMREPPPEAKSGDTPALSQSGAVTPFRRMQ